MSADLYDTADQMLLANEINESGEPFAEADGDEDTPSSRRGVVSDPGFGDPSMNRRSQGNTDEKIRPDLAEDCYDFLSSHGDAVVPGEIGCGVDHLTAESGFEYEGFDPAFELYPAEKQHDRHLVHQRARNQETERHP